MSSPSTVRASVHSARTMVSWRLPIFIPGAPSRRAGTPRRAPRSSGTCRSWSRRARRRPRRPGARRRPPPGPRRRSVSAVTIGAAPESSLSIRPRASPRSTTARAFRERGSRSGRKSTPLSFPPATRTTGSGNPSSAARTAPTLVPLESLKYDTPRTVRTNSTRWGSPGNSASSASTFSRRDPHRPRDADRRQRVLDVLEAPDPHRPPRVPLLPGRRPVDHVVPREEGAFRKLAADRERDLPRPDRGRPRGHLRVVRVDHRRVARPHVAEDRHLGLRVLREIRVPVPVVLGEVQQRRHRRPELLDGLELEAGDLHHPPVVRPAGGRDERRAQVPADEHPRERAGGHPARRASSRWTSRSSR